MSSKPLTHVWVVSSQKGMKNAFATEFEAKEYILDQFMRQHNKDIFLNIWTTNKKKQFKKYLDEFNSSISWETIDRSDLYDLLRQFGVWFEKNQNVTNLRSWEHPAVYTIHKLKLISSPINFIESTIGPSKLF